MLLKINRILILGILFAFLMGSMPGWAKHKSQSRKKPAAAQSVSKSKSKKSTSAKKKTSSKKRRTSSAAKKKKSGSRKTVKSSALHSRVKTQKAAGDSVFNPDDLPALEEDDSEELPVESSTLNVSELFEKYISPNQYAPASDSVNHKEKVIMEIIRFMKTPYKFGGNTSKGIDCSAFTRTVYSNSFSIELPRTAREQYQLGQEIDDKTDLKFGDLVFFNTRRRVKPGHVGIYIGNNQFAHSSSKQGVMVSSLDMDFYSRKFMGGRRVENLLSNR